VNPTGSIVFPMTETDRAEARRLAAETLVEAGITAKDRVVVSLNNDGELGGCLVADAVAGVARAAASIGPRGRMRLLRTIEALRANVLVGTPTGVADFLARLHLEFLVDPLDLELRLIILTGEIADPKSARHLSKEFGARTVNVLSDPLTGIPVAAKGPDDTTLIPTRPGTLELTKATRAGGNLSEIVVRYPWHTSLNEVSVRTGLLVGGDELDLPIHTTGDLVLVRGRWVSFSELTKALRGIDGISTWRLQISRQGTLDSATVIVSFNRASLIDNGMWRGRIQQTIDALTPVSIGVEISATIQEERTPPLLDDQRGQHI
jgi:phenylacetate-CoA ligase